MTKVAGDLRSDLNTLLELRPPLNEAAWYKALHGVLSVKGAFDASSAG